MTQGMDDSQQTERQRKQTLANQIAAEVSRGWRVESQTETMATLVKGKRPNHVLHLLLSVFTVGFWVPVWIIVAVLGGEKRKTVTV